MARFIEPALSAVSVATTILPQIQRDALENNSALSSNEMTEQLYAGFVLGEILGYGVGPFLSFLEMRRSACASQAFFEHLGSARCGLALVARDLRAGGIVAPPHHDARGDPVAAFRAVARALRRRALVSGGSAVARALPSLAPAPSLPSSARCFFSLLNCTSRRLQCCWVGPRGVPVDRAHVDVVEALAPRGGSSASARAPIVLPTHHRSYGAGVPGHTVSLGGSNLPLGSSSSSDHEGSRGGVTRRP